MYKPASVIAAMVHEYCENGLNCIDRVIDRKRPGMNCGTEGTLNMERKIFWLTFVILGLVADLVLPMWWALGATIPICFLSWWVAYRSDWF